MLTVTTSQRCTQVIFQNQEMIKEMKNRTLKFDQAMLNLEKVEKRGLSSRKAKELISSKLEKFTQNATEGTEGIVNRNTFPQIPDNIRKTAKIIKLFNQNPKITTNNLSNKVGFSSTLTKKIIDSLKKGQLYQKHLKKNVAMMMKLIN